MLRAQIGYSINKDAKEAGIELAKMASEGLRNKKLGMLFTSVRYDQEKVIEGVKEVVGNMPIIGCTSSGGIIVPDGVVTSKNGFAGMMILDDPDLKVGVAALKTEGDPRKTGREVALAALENLGCDYAPTYYCMFASPIDKYEEEYYVKGIQDIIGDVPLFGGSAADNTIVGDWEIFDNHTTFNDGVAVAFFYTDKLIETSFTGGYTESKNVGIVTRVEKEHRLMEIDGEPALKKYASWIGVNPDDLMGSNLFVASISNPLGVKDPLGDLIGIRQPMSGNKDYSMTLGNIVSKNTAVIQMEATVDQLIHATGETLKDVSLRLEKPAAYLLIHCGGRKVGIGNRIDEVYEELKEAAGDVPFITIFTFGEYGYKDHTRNTCGGLMLSFTGFDE